MTGKKRAWPLLLAASLSFVPGFGVFFAAAAVTWALVADRPRTTLSLVIGATGGLLNLVTGILLILKLQHGGVLAQAEMLATRRDLTEIVVALEDYHTRQGRYPPDLRILVGVPIPTRLLNIFDRTQSLISTRLYVYHLSDEGSSYDLFAAGADGVPHTADDIRPALTDSLTLYSGYRPAP